MFLYAMLFIFVFTQLSCLSGVYAAKLSLSLQPAPTRTLSFTSHSASTITVQNQETEAAVLGSVLLGVGVGGFVLLDGSVFPIAGGTEAVVVDVDGEDSLSSGTKDNKRQAVEPSYVVVPEASSPSTASSAGTTATPVCGICGSNLGSYSIGHISGDECSGVDFAQTGCEEDAVQCQSFAYGQEQDGNPNDIPVPYCFFFSVPAIIAAGGQVADSCPFLYYDRGCPQENIIID